MKAGKKKRLEAAGWCVSSTEEFLGLSKEEAAIVEMKIALADKVRALRQKHHLSQGQLAERMHSSQSRVAKIEARDPKVSMELLVKAALAAGGTKKEVAKAMTANT